MIAPTPVLIGAAGILTLLGCIAGFIPVLTTVWETVAGIVLGLCLVDLFLSLRRPELSITRSIHHSLPVTVWNNVDLNITNGSRRRLVISVHDLHPADARVRNLPQRIVLNSGQRITCRYELHPTSRGAVSLPGTDLAIDSHLRFWRRKWFFACRDDIMVFPNFKEISHYILLATHHRLSLMGIKKLIRRGEGKEFHQLREYRQGDSLQTIDWKATSRSMKLISKDFQDERDQQVVFVLDSGRRMSHEENGKSHLDQALSSILLLAYVASRQGDAVGLFSFGGTSKWHPPRREERSIRSLLHTVYDIQSAPQSADFLKATQELMAVQKRRTLMVIITNSRSEDHDDLLHMARQLRRKHLVVIADLRESVLDEQIGRPVQNFDDALGYQALQQYLAKRERLLRQLRHLGVFALDVTADKLPAALVNRYLEIKSSGTL